MKTDSEGEKQWSRTYGIAEYDHHSRGNCVRQTSDGGYVVAGATNGGLWLLLTDSLGDTLKTHVYKSEDEGYGFNVQQTDEGGYIVTGSTISLFSSLSNLTPAYGDLWLLRTDNQGDTLWTRTYGGDNSDAGRCVQQTPDGGYIVTGYTSSFGPNGLYLLKTDSLGLLGVAEKPKEESPSNWELVTPIGREIVFRYWDIPQGFHASVFDASGRKIDELNSPGQLGVISWGSDYIPGVYFIQVLDNRDQLTTAKLVLVR